MGLACNLRERTATWQCEAGHDNVADKVLSTVSTDSSNSKMVISKARHNRCDSLANRKAVPRWVTRRDRDGSGNGVGLC